MFYSDVKKNWSWPGKQGSNNVLLTEKATHAENRLKAIKKAAKGFRRSVEDSLRTSSSKHKHEDLEQRKKRTVEFLLGDNLASAVLALNEDKKLPVTNLACGTTSSQHHPKEGVAIAPPAIGGGSNVVTTGGPSPLNTILERYANFEKTIGHMLAVNEMTIETFLSSDTPIAKLLREEIPAINTAKKELEHLSRRQHQSMHNLEREEKKLEKMQQNEENEADPEVMQQQVEKRDRLAHEVESLSKDVGMEQDKLTSALMTLVSRENRYAASVLELMRIKKQFYENAFNTISAELPNIERILNDTPRRPVFGERLEDHLKSTGRLIAYPIAMAVTYLRQSGLNDEGLFRISAKQIKLDKLKAHLDAGLHCEDIRHLMDGGDSDPHLYSALLKSYLRGLPVPLLGRCESSVYQRWIAASRLKLEKDRVTVIHNILDEDLPPNVQLNIQYLIKFLSELSTRSQATKMTPHNIAIVLGPTLLWNDRDSVNEQNNIEGIISIVGTLIQSYHEIFTLDFEWSKYTDERLEATLARVREEAEIREDDNLLRHSEMLQPHQKNDNCEESGTKSITGGGASAHLSPITTTTSPHQSPSPNNKRRPSFRTKILSKLNSPGTKVFDLEKEYSSPY